MKKFGILAALFAVALCVMGCSDDEDDLYDWYTVESGTVTQAEYDSAYTNSTNSDAYLKAQYANDTLKSKATNKSSDAYKEGDLKGALTSLGLSDSEAATAVQTVSDHSKNYITYKSGKYIYAVYYNHQRNKPTL